MGRVNTGSAKPQRRSRAALAACLVALLLAVLGAFQPALASAVEPWSALWLGQCCVTESGSVVELEAGEARWSAFTARNIGLNTWHSSGSIVVHLGTSEPRDRSSALYYAGPGEGAWSSANRPATVSPATVAPGESARFRFRVLAPNSPGELKEYFEPVADGSGGGWMGTPLSSGCTAARWCGANLIYRIQLRQPPAISMGSPPESVAAGSPVTINTVATDNVGLDRVVASVDGSDIHSDDLPAPDADVLDATFGGGQLFKSRQSTFVFSPPACRWSVGQHTVKAVAYDLLGQTDQVSRTITALPDGDCDGVADASDRCPTLRVLSPESSDGCPPPEGFAARSAFLYAAPGRKKYRKEDKITSGEVRHVRAGAQIKAFCRPSCGGPFTRFVRDNVKAVKVAQLSHKLVPDGTKVVIRVTLERSRNVFGREWTWMVRNGAKGGRFKCLAPGRAGRPRCS